MESKQFRDVKILQGRGIVTKKQKGNKYTKCSENEEQGAQNEICGENGEGEEDEQSNRESRSPVFIKICGKYLRYWRNFFMYFFKSLHVATGGLQVMVKTVLH